MHQFNFYKLHYLREKLLVIHSLTQYLQRKLRILLNIDEIQRDIMNETHEICYLNVIYFMLQK